MYTYIMWTVVLPPCILISSVVVLALECSKSCKRSGGVVFSVSVTVLQYSSEHTNKHVVGMAMYNKNEFFLTLLACGTHCAIYYSCTTCTLTTTMFVFGVHYIGINLASIISSASAAITPFFFFNTAILGNLTEIPL